MSLLSAHIPLLFGAACSIVSLLAMSAVTITGFHYLRAMETAQAKARLRAETPRARRTPPRY